MHHNAPSFVCFVVQAIKSLLCASKWVPPLLNEMLYRCMMITEAYIEKTAKEHCGV